ncbi:protein CYP567E1 [Aspergillus nidulans FGSC A4]|uniref:Cytochrome P450, putative (Eurofung) n=1 Tax=Emericella nidulans (strain FGSC A4 / ATCC 38163 / CBS 112.46 / NRRL 194 / M139) TaxID=227321 RepID=C8VI27_EMENI|nr:protein CYP567E1 [Aspergillus nidulans FGSC A4]CBF83049.1 TPA: cytochrome P450, putative (Eurofung) [Aspergillus nidulans FGSC A4]
MVPYGTCETMDHFRGQPALVLIGASALVGIITWIARLLIRAFVSHPLAHFPGPRLSALSNLNYSWSYMGGRQPYDILNLHAEYGSVVRVAPNELSFNTAQSWKDIYAPRKGRATFIKSDFYDGGNFADQASSIVSERDPARHSAMRKFLSAAFSDRSLREQEGLVTRVIDDFIDQVGQRGNSKDGVDMTMWTNLLTFDIIGELAFGESFHGLETGSLHFWIAVVLESMGQAGLSDFLKRFPIIGRVFLKLNPRWLNKLMDGAIKHQTYTIDLVKRRIQQKTNRKDFMSYLLLERNSSQISDIQLAAHASDFVIAGSETTATCLATVIYYVGRNPRILKTLQEEVRSAFRNYEEINGQSTSSLKYLHAVCLEALRIFPPLALALPRVVPEGGEMIDGHFVPEKTIVSTNPLAASMDPANFDTPWAFCPERWIRLSEKDQLEASQPFSMGSRSCLGRGLAWLELRLTLAKLYYRYDLKLVDDELDWHRDAAMHLLWVKPKLMTQVLPRAK